MFFKLRKEHSRICNLIKRVNQSKLLFLPHLFRSHKLSKLSSIHSNFYPHHFWDLFPMSNKWYLLQVFTVFHLALGIYSLFHYNNKRTLIQTFFHFFLLHNIFYINFLVYLTYIIFPRLNIEVLLKNPPRPFFLELVKW